MKQIMTLLSSVIGFINQSIAATGIAAGVALAFYNVVARYAFHASLTWSSQLTIYFFLWSTFFGAAYCFKEDAHIGITNFVDNLQPKNAKIVMIFSHIVTLIFLISISYYGYIFMMDQLQDIFLDDLWYIPAWIPYMAIPLSFAFGAFRVGQKLAYIIKTPGDKIIRQSEAEMIVAEIEASAHDDLIKEVEKRTGGML